MNVIDSSGWIEFFLAGPSGPLFKPVIEERDTLLVPVIALYKVHKILSRKLPIEKVEQALNVMRFGRVLDLTDRRAIAVMYSVALEFKATFWTQDVDYQGLPSVNYFPKP